MSVHRLRMAHFSMRAQLTDKQMRHDCEQVFDHAVRRDYAWMTGTEAGGASDMAEHLQTEATAAGFKLARPKGQDCWIAVNRDYYGGGWDPYFDEIIPADGQAPARHTAKGVAAVSFDCPQLGREVTVIAEHLLTQKNPGADEKNQRLIRATNEFAHRKGRGRKLVFLGADANMDDRLKNIYPDLTTIGDELKNWVRTGHGRIDVIASFNLDGSVQGRAVRDIPDSTLRLFSDHEGVEAEYDVLVRGLR